MNIWDTVSGFGRTEADLLKPVRGDTPSAPTLSDQVKRLEESVSALNELCGEMIATFTINRMRGTITFVNDEAGAEFDTYVERWKNRRSKALSNGHAEAWLHVLDNTDGIPENTPMKQLTFSPDNPFGKPGEDYSAEYEVTSIPLYKKP